MRTHALRFLGIAALALAACSPEQETVVGPSAAMMTARSAPAPLGISSANTLASGIIGSTTVDPAATSGTYYLRHVGSPPDETLGSNYRHTYQWASPRLMVLPESGPVVLHASLDLSAQPVGSVGFLGLLDAKALADGGAVTDTNPAIRYKFAGYQSGAYVYIHRSSTGWTIAPSDGNLSGDLRQVFVSIANADMPLDQTLRVSLTVDGTADPNSCHDNAPGTAPAGSQGCMTLVVSGQTGGPQTVTDSYGAIKYGYPTYHPREAYDHTEFQYGAVLGWDDYLASSVDYAVVVDADDMPPTVSDVALDPASAYPGDAIDLTANVVAVGVNESMKGAEYNIDGGSWTAMTQGTGDAWGATFTAPTPASYPGSYSVCVRGTDGLTGTTLSDETSDGTACATLTVMEPDNDPPVLSALGATSASFGSPVSLSVNVTDANSVTVEYTVNGGTNWYPMSGTGPTYTASVSGLSAGTYFACYRATDSFGNVTAPTTYTAGDPACTEFNVTADQMVVTFTGQFVDEDGGQTTLSATVTPTGCGAGALVTFEYTNLLTNETLSATATANGSGEASVPVTLAPGLAYDVEASVADRDLAGSADPECLADSDMGSTMALDPNAASSGGGWYAAPVASGSPRVNFGYTVNLKFNKKTGLTTVSGNLLWHNNEDSRLKGTITSYGKVACQTVEGATFGTCALVGGTGMLYDYNPSYDPMDPASQAWINGRTVTFSFLAYDGGVVTIRKKKNNKPDAFGLTIAGQSVDAESAPMLLKGGNLIVK